MSSGDLPKVSGDGTTTRTRAGDIFDRVTRFIKEVGFPIAVAAVFLAYMWFVGIKTNEHLAKGSEIQLRSIQVLERLEKKLQPE